MKRSAAVSRRRGVRLSDASLHARVWASLTLAGFLVVYILSIVIGAGGVLPFVYGAAFLLSILLVEAGLRGRIWPFEDGFRERFDHPTLPFRLVLFSAALLLLIETLIMIRLLGWLVY